MAVHHDYATVCNATTKETTKTFHLHFCLILCASFKKTKGFTETQAVKPWLKIYLAEKNLVFFISGP